LLKSVAPTGRLPCGIRYCEEAQGRGLKVIIAGAGGAAHLPGMAAAKTLLPVLGVPVQSKALNGLDSKSLSSVGWWPDGYDRFTNALSALQALREQIAMDNRLTLAPWLETYLLTQISTQHAPDLIERVGRLAAVGQASVVSGQFTLQSRLQLRDLRSRIGDAREQLAKTAGLLEARLPSALQTWADQ